MAKKKAAVDPDVQSAEDELLGILQSLDNYGVQLVESDWRKMTESENDSAIAWAAARRIGKNPQLPLCLIPFASAELRAEQNRYLASQEEGRKVLAPCTFCKPSFDKSEEGDEIIRVKVKVPDAHMTGSTAHELLGKTRVRAEFSRRPMAEWNQMELTDDGPRRIISCETDIPSFGWSDGNWQFAFLISADSFSLEDAIESWKKQGSIRLQVIGEAVESDGSDVESARPAAKPKAKKEAKPKGPALPGVESASERYSVAFTADYRVGIKVTQQSDGKFACQWEGVGPAGGCEQSEPSIRVSENESAIASIGNAVDFWGTYSDEQSKDVVADLKRWLSALEAGKSPRLIEAESESDKLPTILDAKQS